MFLCIFCLFWPLGLLAVQIICSLQLEIKIEINIEALLLLLINNLIIMKKIFIKLMLTQKTALITKVNNYKYLIHY